MRVKIYSEPLKKQILEKGGILPPFLKYHYNFYIMHIHTNHMKYCINLEQKSMLNGDSPVGSVLVKNNKVNLLICTR